MVTIGNDTLPGTIKTIESAPSVGVSVGAPGTPVLIGQADLANGDADPDTAYRVTRAKRARDLFGLASNSQLTTAIQDALVDGANPVFAISPVEQRDHNEDLSTGSGQDFQLSNAPIREDVDDIEITINSTTKTVTLYLDGDPQNATPDTDEVLLNPQTGFARADEAIGNSGDEAIYDYLDYSNTFEEVTDATIGGNVHLREVVDFVVPLDEKESVKNSAHSKVESMESNSWFAIALAGAGEPWLDSSSSYGNVTVAYDSSRLQLVYPSRKNDGRTLLGGYAGKRSELGIDAVPIFNRIDTANDLQFNLSKASQENLVNAKIIPIEERRGAARIVEDLTTVTDSNTEEAAWQRGFARLVTDFIVETADAEAEPFIGEFNNVDVRNTFASNVVSELDALLDSNSIEAYSVVVEEVDSVTAALDVGINTADPLRNIEITVASGEVRNGTSVEVN
jgi:hypothetical protein